MQLSILYGFASMKDFLMLSEDLYAFKIYSKPMCISNCINCTTIMHMVNTHLLG